MLFACVAHAVGDPEWTLQVHTSLQFEVMAPVTWVRFDPRKNANSPMGDLELTSSEHPRVTFDLSSDRQGRQFLDMVQMMDETTGAHQTNGMIIERHRSAGTNDFGNEWVMYDTLTVEADQTNRISMILVDGRDKPTLIGTFFIHEDLDEKNKAVLKRVHQSIRHSEPNQGTGSPWTAHPSAVP